MKGENLTVLEQTTQLTHRLRTRGCPHNLIEKNYLESFICWTEVGFSTKQLSLKKKILFFVQSQGSRVEINSKWRYKICTCLVILGEVVVGRTSITKAYVL